MTEALPTALSPGALREFVGENARTILEIGAHDGKDTRRFLNAYPQANIYAFEPEPRAIAKFRQRGEHPRLRFYETAVGAHDGRALFHASGGDLPPDATPEHRALYREGWDKSGSLHAPKGHTKIWPWVTFEKTIEVPVVRLDTWAKAEGVGDVDLIWADVQGAEGDLIAGGRETLQRTRWFYTEYSDDECFEGQPSLSQLLDMLPGFSVHARFPMDVLLRNVRLDDAHAARRRFGAAL